MKIQIYRYISPFFLHNVHNTSHIYTSNIIQLSAESFFFQLSVCNEQRFLYVFLYSFCHRTDLLCASASVRCAICRWWQFYLTFFFLLFLLYLHYFRIRIRFASLYVFDFESARKIVCVTTANYSYARTAQRERKRDLIMEDWNEIEHK